MMHTRRRLLIALAGGIVLTSLQACAKQEFHLSANMWIAADQDIAIGTLRFPDGRALYERATMGRYDPEYEGWTGGGPGRGFYKEIPDHILVSWHLPSPNETPAERCERRGGEGDCEKLPGYGDRVVRKDGQLVGPFKVPLKSRIPKETLALFEKADTPSLEIGISLGLTVPKLRWIMYGRPPGSTAGVMVGKDYPKRVELGRGGDW